MKKPVNSQHTSISPERPQEATDLQLHLRVLGGLLEQTNLYEATRLEAAKSIVHQAIHERTDRNSTTQDILSVLCVDGIRLVSEEVVRTALRALQVDNRIERVSTGPSRYKSCAQPPAPSTRLFDAISASYDRHFTTLTNREELKPLFTRCISKLFAEHGCAAYNNLTSKQRTRVNAEQIIRDTIPEHHATEFIESFEAFIQSSEPDDSTVKVNLAAAYMTLRMNGAGNWDPNAIATFFRNTTFIVDTNVLFELTSERHQQVAKVFRKMTILGAKLVVSSETLHEFETAMRSRALQLGNLLAKGVDALALVEHNLLQADWIRALLSDNRTPTRSQLNERVERLTLQVRSIVDEEGVTSLHIDRGEDDKLIAERIEYVKSESLHLRGYAKPDPIARHDALMWCATDQEPTLADRILTMDRSLTTIRSKRDRPVAILFDQVMSYVVMGTAERSEIADLMDHAIRIDFTPRGRNFSIQDIETIASIESKLLLARPRALKVAAVELGNIRRARAGFGEDVSNEEVGRILLRVINSHPEHEQALEELSKTREREEAQAAEIAAANRKLEDNEQNHSIERKSHAESLSASSQENVKLQARLDEERRLREADRKESERKDTLSRRRRDFIFYGIAFIAVGTLVFIGGLHFAGVAMGSIGVLILVAAGVVSELPEAPLLLVASTLISIVVISVTASTGSITRLVGRVLGLSSAPPTPSSSVSTVPASAGSAPSGTSK